MSRFFWLRILSIFMLLLILCFGVSNATSNSSNTTVGLNSVGELVVRVQLRLRELGYLNFKPTGNFRSMTQTATIAFQQAQTDASGSFIYADGTVGPQTQSVLFSARASRASIPANISMPIGPPLSGASIITGAIVSWNEVKEMLTVNSTYTVTDYNTGVSFEVKYLGGEGHAEVECATSDDTGIFIESFGNEYNYSKRPVVIDINGRNIAASLFGYPHGEDHVSDNNMTGHTCLYFDGSISHVGNVTDIEHQKQIYVASGS